MSLGCSDVLVTSQNVWETVLFYQYFYLLHSLIIFVSFKEIYIRNMEKLRLQVCLYEWIYQVYSVSFAIKWKRFFFFILLQHWKQQTVVPWSPKAWDHIDFYSI